MRILIIGYGSIGRRHREVLGELYPDAEIDIASSHAESARFKTLEDVVDPSVYDYFVVASETGAHRDQLLRLDAVVEGKSILVEKPLFSEHQDIRAPRNRVFIGYNLRFHPMIEQLREFARNRRILTINAAVGQYLPDWRPGTDYRHSYSSSRRRGGGVLLDLSHEIDYVQWLSGPFETVKSIGGKISQLEIDSEDFCAIIGETMRGVRATLSLDYLSRIPVRRIHINAEDASCICDLIEGSFRTSDASVESYQKRSVQPERNATYTAMHIDILERGGTRACTFAEGLEVMRTIDKAKAAMEEFPA